MSHRWAATDPDDLCALLDVLDRVRPAADDDIFYADVLAGLRELIPCFDITFQLMDVAEKRVWTLCVNDSGVEREEVVGTTDEYLTLFWQQFWGEHGCAGPLRTGDHSTLLHHAETSRGRAYANTPFGSLLDDLGGEGRALGPVATARGPGPTPPALAQQG